MLSSTLFYMYAILTILSLLCFGYSANEARIYAKSSDGSGGAGFLQFIFFMVVCLALASLFGLTSLALK